MSRRESGPTSGMSVSEKLLVSLGGLACHTVCGSGSFLQLSASLFKAPAAVSPSRRDAALDLPGFSPPSREPAPSLTDSLWTRDGTLQNVFSKIGTEKQAICISEGNAECQLAKR